MLLACRCADDVFRREAMRHAAYMAIYAMSDTIRL